MWENVPPSCCISPQQKHTVSIPILLFFLVCNKREHSLFRFSFLIQFSSLFVGSHSDFRLSLASELLSLILLRGKYQSQHTFIAQYDFIFYNVTRFKIQKIEDRIDSLFGICSNKNESMHTHKVRVISQCELQNGNCRP